MECLFDTNVYRDIADTLTLEEIPSYIKDLKLKEDAKDIKSGFSIVVAMELIQHLEEGDNHFEDCYKALCLLVYHTQRINPDTLMPHGDFYPPLNVILTKHFFNEDSIYLPLYLKVLNFAHELTKNLDFEKCRRLQHNIKIIRQQVIHEKKQIKDNVELFLSSMNSGTLDWSYFQNNSKERKKWFRDLASGHTINLIAYALMKRAYQIMEIEELRIDAEDKFNLFLKDYYPGLLMNEIIFQSIGSGTEALGDVNDKRWNTINDISIMFGVLYQADKRHKILVTGDKKIKECFQKVDLGKRAISLEEFYNLLY
jgi:hypothetical protein